MLKANGHECLFLKGFGVEDSVVVQICWLSAIRLGVVVVHEDFVVAVLCLYVDVVGLAELLEVEALHEMLVDELQDFLRVEEADAADVYQVLDKYSVLVALGLFLWSFAAPVRLVEQRRAFGAYIELLAKILVLFVLLLLSDACVLNSLVLSVLAVDHCSNRVILREDEIVDQFLLLHHSAFSSSQAGGPILLTCLVYLL